MKSVGVMLLVLSMLSVAVLQAEPPKKGGASLTTGTALQPGFLPVARPRFDSFVPGLTGEERLVIERKLPPFRRTKPSGVVSQVEIAFFANSRPVRIQATLLLEGKPLAEKWDSHLLKLFKSFDRDGNGHLNRFEMEQIYSARGMIGLLHGSYFYRNPVGAPVWEELDLDRDGQISFEELADYYEESAKELLQVRELTLLTTTSPDPNFTPTNTQLTDAIFNLLDQNHDGKLSREEIRNAEQVLFKQDLNDDGVLTSAELLPSRDRVEFLGIPPATPTTGSDSKAQKPSQNTNRLFVYPGKFIPEMITEMEALYAKSTFSPKEDFQKWLNGPPDLKATISLGTGGTSPTSSDVELTPGKGALPPGSEIRADGQARKIVKIGNQFLDFGTRVMDSQQLAIRKAANPEYAFPSGKNVITEADIGGPQYQFLRIIYDSADFNGDGKLTRAEYDRYMNMQHELVHFPLLFGHAVQTPDLFQLLDENNDGRISIRELRTAWDRLIVLEPDGKEFVTRAALQPSVWLQLSHNADTSANLKVRRIGQISHYKGDPPIWFQKMDRNKDGDISKFEFLGSSADFDRLDTNKDGLISTEEAQAFEESQKKSPPKK